MRPVNDEFDPLTEEELRRLQEDEEFRRRVRREVLRMQSGDADTDIERDREEQRAEEQGKSLQEMSLEEMDGYWNEAKELERK